MDLFEPVVLVPEGESADGGAPGGLMTHWRHGSVEHCWASKLHDFWERPEARRHHVVSEDPFAFFTA